MRALSKAVAFLSIALTAVAASAQTACPYGAIPGSALCLPDEEVEAPPQRAARWKTTWGALAADKGGSVVGTSTAQMSKRLAERAALKRCREMGGKNCEVSFSYENQCVAVALLSGEMVSDAVMSYVSAATVDEAKAKSLRNCSEGNGGGICEVGYSNCTAPVLIR